VWKKKKKSNTMTFCWKFLSRYKKCSCTVSDMTWRYCKEELSDEVSKDVNQEKFTKKTPRKEILMERRVEMPDLSRDGFRCQEKVRNQIERRS